MAEFFTSKEWLDAVDIFKTEVPLAIWETVYVTLLSTLIALISVDMFSWFSMDLFSSS